LQEIDFKTFINGIGNDFKIAIDDIIGAISTIHEDVETLKVKASKPDKDTAKALLKYFAMTDDKVKQNTETLCGKQINLCLKWLEDYCSEHNCTQEEALKRIIDEN